MARSPGRPDAQAPRRASAAQNLKAIFGVWRFDRCEPHRPAARNSRSRLSGDARRNGSNGDDLTMAERAAWPPADAAAPPPPHQTGAVSAHRLGELIEPLPCIPRPELRRLLVPAARLGQIGGDPDHTKALEDQRIEGSTECKRGLCIAAFGRAAKRQARGGDIADDEKGTTAGE